MTEPDKPAIEMTPEEKAALLERLNALGQSLTRTRDTAVAGRHACGIETIWDEDTAYYESIDEATKGSGGDPKPPYQKTPQGADQTSTEFLNITRPYVDAAAAKVGDILLQTDDPSWKLTNTPIPDLDDRTRGVLPPEVEEGFRVQGIPLDAQQKVRETEAANAKKVLDEAVAKALKAEKRIVDWHVECQWHAEVRRVIEDCCKIGSGVLKGPIPMSKRVTMYKDGELVVVDEIKPVSKRVNPRNFYPDPACGDSIHKGNYVWETDFLTRKVLSDLKRDPDFIASQIDECLREGPKRGAEQRKTAEGKAVDDKELFQVWYFYGMAEREDLEAAGCKCPEGDTTSIPAIITMVNDRVIKAALNPLDSGEFPYDVMPWQRRENMPWGFGVARQIRTPQRIVLAANRVMLTNAGRSAGPIFALHGSLSGADGNDDLTPWKVFRPNESEVTDDVRKLIAMLEIPDRQASLMAIIQFGLKMAEDVTGLPLLLQGQAGSAPETLGGQQLVDRNASGVLRRIARTFDDCITEPHVRRYYNWLLQYGEDDEKGDFVIDARGSTALVERDIHKTEVQQLLQASLNPAFDLDPAKTMAEHLRTTKKRPEDFQLTPEQKEAKAQAAQQQPPQDNSLAVAKVRQETEIQKVQANQQSDMAELKFKATEAEKQRQHEARMKSIEFNLKVMEFAERRNMGLDQVKAQLAGKAMTLRSQEKLAKQPGPDPQVARPVAEPPGRAPNGQAFPR